MVCSNSIAFPINENLYFNVNKTAIAQTRKVFMTFDISNLKDPPMPPNSVCVYHLDLLEKSKFKDLVIHSSPRSESARATFLSRGKSSVSNLSGIYDQILKATHVTYYQGHYVALFMLGSERWQCEPCSPNKCYKQAFNAIYKYTESSTYKKLDCVAESGCSNSVFQCNVDSRLCFYTQTYDNGEKTIGFLATDIITFVGDNTQARITFGCGVNLVSGTGQFANTYSGIIALGKRLSSRNPGIYSLPSQLGSNLFALCLPTAEAATGSFLTFNKAPWVYGTEAKILKNRQEPHYYYVNLYKIFINDEEIPVDPTWWNGQKEDHGAFVDTGTLISRFPHDYYIIFRYAFRAQVHYPLYQHSIGGVFDTCYKEIEGEEEIQFPSVRLFFGNVSVTQEL
ncbi:aspartyl protease AED1-like, partial [Capsicum annuum]|uniref:aspartyl protease AED1-like n=1 Tax=Capsicum annuum TaxID=4072 RepID=UPI001FB18DBF